MTSLPSPREPTFCLYHANCADGFTAAWAIWRRWPNAKFFPASYGSAVADTLKAELPLLKFTPHVLLVDFSYPADQLRALAFYTDVTVLDHHKTAQADLQPLLDDGTVAGVFDMERSGAMLAWQYANPTRHYPPSLVQHVQDRDLWRFEMHDTRAIHAWLSTRPYTFARWEEANDILNCLPARERAIVAGECVLAKQDLDIKSVIRSAGGRKLTIGGHRVPVANCPYWLVSETGNRLSVGQPFSATYVDTATGRGWSLRSQPDGVDVSDIAKLYGGGGHARAAGFHTDHAWMGDVP